MMRHIFSFRAHLPLTATALFLLAFASDAAAQCQGGPTVNFTPGARNWHLTATQTWPPSFFSNVDNAAKAWSQMFADRGQSSSSISHGAGDITIIQTTLSGYAVGDQANNILYVDPSLFAPSVNPQFAYALMLHELGHFMGFSQASGQDSVMSDTTESSFRTGFTSCDIMQFNYYYGRPAGDAPPPDCPTCNYYNPESRLCEINPDCPGSPIIINLGPAMSTFTSPDVSFDLLATGQPELVSWTSEGGDDGFLVLDRDKDGRISSGLELFGNVTPLSWTPFGPKAANGFEALAFFDARDNGGNGDGWISASDAVYEQLQIWVDSNHDGVSDPWELRSLAACGIVAISVEYKQSSRRDVIGNIYRYRAPVLLMRPNGALVHRFAYDVYFVFR